MFWFSFLYLLHMKSPEHQSFELDKQAGDHLSKPQQAGTFRRFMNYLGLTQKEIEVLKKSDLHFDDPSKEVFSGIVDGHILEGIGSGEGRRPVVYHHTGNQTTLPNRSAPINRSTSPLRDVMSESIPRSYEVVCIRTDKNSP
jgi:hypothetical protein